MEIEYTLIRSKRKTLAIQVDFDCQITVRAPLTLSQKEIDKFILQKKAWLEKAVASQKERASNKKEYSDEDIKNLRENAKRIIPQKVDYFSKIMGVEPSNVKINSAKKRYGSCSDKNSLNFSLYLMDKDERFIDYVVVHELAHIKHHNHSREFYAFIEKILPDYKDRIKLEKN